MNWVKEMGSGLGLVGHLLARRFLYAVTLIKKIAKFAYFCIPRLVVKFGPRLQPDDFVVVEQRFGI